VRPLFKAPREAGSWFRFGTGLQLNAVQQFSLNKKMKTKNMTTLHLKHSINRSFLRLGLLLIPLVLVCFTLSPTARAADGGLPGFNTAEGVGALSSLTTGTANTGLGENALKSNTTGNNNTATGSGALFSSSTGNNNTATGNQALVLNTTGTNNTATGNVALFFNSTGSFNTAIGGGALNSNTSGSLNTAIGLDALRHNNDGNQNNAFGHAALLSNVTGDFNNAFGDIALASSTGDFNTAFGDEAGLNVSSGSGNTFIGSSAGEAVSTANGVVCIGRNVVGSNTADNRTFVGNVGTFPQATSATVDFVTVELTSGKLGHVASSGRYKEDIKPMDKASELLYQLKPVTFRFKKDLENPSPVLDYGLIAEDVAKIDPKLAVRDGKGQIESVRYMAIYNMMLNEFLKEHQKVQQLEATVAQQQKGMEVLTAQLKEQASQIQKVSAQLEVNKPTPKVVLNHP
jgi:hypothetical protein